MEMHALEQNPGAAALEKLFFLWQNTGLCFVQGMFWVSW